MTCGNPYIKNAAWLEFWSLCIDGVLHPIGNGFASAITQRSDRATGGDKKAGVVVGSRSNVTSYQLPIVAAGHTVMVYFSHIGWNLNVRVQLEIGISFIQRMRLCGQIIELAQNNGSAALLPNLHEIAPHSTPETVKGVFIHRLTNFVAAPGVPTLVCLKRRAHFGFVSQLIPWRKTGCDKTIAGGKKVQSRPFVMIKLRIHSMLFSSGNRRRHIKGHSRTCFHHSQATSSPAKFLS